MAQDYINLDYESRSRVNLKTEGFDRYSSSPSTEIIMAAWSVNDGKIQFHDKMARPKLNPELVDALRDPDVIKWGFNAQFERVMTERVLGIKTDPRSWRCTMVLAYMLGFSGDLALIGRTIGLESDKLKDAEGKALIKRFCSPRKPTKKEPWEWCDEITHPEEWERFCAYNRQDVVTEMAIKRRLQKYPVMDSEWELYAIDQAINDRGIYVDQDYARSALQMADRSKPLIISAMRDITGLANPNAPAQLQPWLKDEGYPFDDLRADTIKKVINERDSNGISDTAVEVLELRQNSAKSSISKYKVMTTKVGYDSYFRYSLQFWGAQRTGRWAGRALQTHNLPRTPKMLEPMEDQHIVRDIIARGDVDALSLYCGEPMNALVGMIRGALTPTPGYRFVVADLASIESVVIGYITGCRWFLDTLAAGRDLYRSFASHWLHIDYEDTKPHRGKAKPATLGAGYRLGGGELRDGKKTGLWGYAENMGVHMTQQEAKDSVNAFRNLCPEIVDAWDELENAVFKCLKTKMPAHWRDITIEFKAPFLTIKLPSGRRLYYYKPAIREKEFPYLDKKTGELRSYTKKNFSYFGKAEGTNKWGLQFSHGGKLIENIVQAIARDILVCGLRNAIKDGFRVVLHVHDEIICEVPKNEKVLNGDKLVECMAAPIKWAPGIPLGAEAWEGYFYRKG